MNRLGMMKLQVLGVAAVAAAGVLFGATGARAQVPKPRLVTEGVEESNRVTLHGNVHPFARAEFDQGAMADSQPVNRIYLLLDRSAEQQQERCRTPQTSFTLFVSLAVQVLLSHSRSCRSGC